MKGKKKGKLFTIYKENAEVHLAPGHKILPAKEFTTLLEAGDILAKAQVDAEHYKQEVAKACEKEKEQAQREGFAQGMQKWAGQLMLLEAETTKVHDRLSKSIVSLAIKAAKKIVGREIELDESTTADIVANTLRAVSDHKTITIYVNIREYDLMNKHKSKLKAVFDRLDSLSIQTRDDLRPGACVIETEAGIINAELENQWGQLEEALQNIVDKRNEV